jgi:hypothetical protein
VANELNPKWSVSKFSVVFGWNLIQNLRVKICPKSFSAEIKFLKIDPRCLVGTYARPAERARPAEARPRHEEGRGAGWQERPDVENVGGDGRRQEGDRHLHPGADLTTANPTYDF